MYYEVNEESDRCYLEERRKRKCGEGAAEVWKLFRRSGSVLLKENVI